MAKRLTQEQFLEKANIKHNSLYDYSLVKYKKYTTKITIICKKHGKFRLTADSHLQGVGCKKCAKIKTGLRFKSNTDKFIKKATIIHNNRYDYSLSKYTYVQNTVIIICPIHGKFKQRANTHLNGCGCPNCGKIQRKASIKKHGNVNTGSWSYTEWKKLGSKSKNFENYQVYIIECEKNNEKFYKIGKTFRNIKKRFEKPRDMPYNWKIIKIYQGEARDMCMLEKKLQKINKNNKYLPKIFFPGRLECFSKIAK